MSFVRHGETDWNREGRMQGRMESDLTARGEEQVRVNAHVLAAIGIEAIVASTARRAASSAQIIAGIVGCPVRYDARLVEWDAGSWSGRLRADVAKEEPEAWAAWVAEPWRVASPGGETMADLVVRGRPVIDEVLAGEPRHTAIVSHGFIGRALMGDLLGLEPEVAARMHTPNDTFFRLQQGSGGRWTADRFSVGEGPMPWNDE